MFPERTKFLRRPIEWQDLGEIDTHHTIENGKGDGYG